MLGLAGHNRGVANHFGQIHTLEDGDKITLHHEARHARTYEVFYVGQGLKKRISPAWAGAARI